MRRWIFNILAAISLVLCLATAGLWVRSYWQMDVWSRASSVDGQLRQTCAWIHSNSGVLAIWHDTEHYSHNPGIGSVPPGWDTTSGDATTYAMAITASSAGGVSFLGFGYGRRHGPTTLMMTPGSSDAWDIFLPYWFLFYLFAALPIRWAILKRQELRLRPPHLCKTCGYDLRATPDAAGPLLDRCPECGTRAPEQIAPR